MKKNVDKIFSIIVFPPSSLDTLEVSPPLLVRDFGKLKVHLVRAKKQFLLWVVHLKGNQWYYYWWHCEDVHRSLFSVFRPTLKWIHYALHPDVLLHTQWVCSSLAAYRAGAITSFWVHSTHTHTHTHTHTTLHHLGLVSACDVQTQTPHQAHLGLRDGPTALKCQRELAIHCSFSVFNNAVSL